MQNRKTIKFSCVILCYNYGRFLSQAIESCLQQEQNGKFEFEVLVIDDGSTDETPEICRSYGSAIQVISGPNLGFAKSLERAFTQSQGDFVCLLDADDWWAPNKLKTIASVINNKVYFVKHPMYEVLGTGEPAGAIGSAGNTSSLCVKREAALALLPAVTELFCHPLADFGLGVSIDVPLGFYRIHAQSMTDRTRNGKQTRLMAATAWSTYHNVMRLASSPPAWAPSPKQVKRVAAKYKCEALLKDLWLAEEVSESRQIPAAAWRLIKHMAIHGIRPHTIHARVLARSVRHYGRWMLSRAKQG